MKKGKTMSVYAAEYLAYRRSLGFRLHVEGSMVQQFSEYADRRYKGSPLTTEIVLEWARLPRERSSLYWAKRLESVRPFAKYLAVFEPETEIPPHRILGNAHRRRPPYIYSDAETIDLLKAASELWPCGGLRPKTYQTLFGLLACSGIRIGEALRLERQDADLQEGVLTIRETKFHKSRLVPLEGSAVEKLCEYARDRDKRYPLVQTRRFLLSERGNALNASTVSYTFLRLRSRLGWVRTGGGRAPRIYDFRHTFACKRLLKWYEEGVDIDHGMASLSTYLGHVKVSDTYWYLTGVPALLQEAAKRFEHFQENH